MEEESYDFKPIVPSCGICLEEFQLVHSPNNAASLHDASSSAKLPFGLSLPCTGSHKYCQDCLRSYIQSKIDPEGDGSGNPNTVVFPIKCPECPIAQWPSGIQDDLATRVLSEKDMLLWVSPLVKSFRTGTDIPLAPSETTRYTSQTVLPKYSLFRPCSGSRRSR